MNKRLIDIQCVRESQTFRSVLCLNNASLDELTASKEQFFHPDEITRFNTFDSPIRQHSYLAGRFAAKSAVTHYADLTAPPEINIESGIFSQPILKLNYDEPLQVSISHSGNIAAAIVFPEAHPMAVDVECVNPDLVQAAKTQMTGREIELISGVDLPDDVKLTVMWTAKEALSKVLKVGMMTPFKLLEVTQIEQKEQFIECQFKNFGQYKALCFIRDDSVLSIISPKRSELIFSELPII